MPARRPLDPAPLLEQSARVREWLAHLDSVDLSRPLSGLAGTVADLVVHLEMVHTELDQSLDRPTRERALPLRDVVRRHPAGVGAVETVLDPRPALETAAGVLARRLAQPLPERVRGPRGPAATTDLLATRLLELVVHADDLSCSLPGREPVPITRRAWADSVRTLTALLAAEHPGRSVEVRVPPYAAVQCGLPGDPGPTHTRGTPPNVVECEPTIFLRLALGRLSWTEARSGADVRASGLRADLSDVLPLLG